ncbi:MAG: DUF2075 domain-containing protein [Verrucomicrobiae bacterium]|nr:DUF2075 domain-containing protein [Verrucomicrobiae bacterium]
MPAFYRATFAEFLADEPSRVLGVLASRSAQQGFTNLKQRQTRAWEKQIAALRATTAALAVSVPTSARWGVLLEYPIPRRQKRIDAVILAADVIFCLEFKTEEREHKADARQQAEDYALDLRDFHEESRNRRIIPVAIALRAGAAPVGRSAASTEVVRPVVSANESQLAHVIEVGLAAETSGGSQLDVARWDSSAYRPVPTIIEAAEALFAGHDVREIAHSHAGATNLTATSARLLEIIRDAQAHRQKLVCFVTGIPGAGKTLAGLNVVHNPALRAGGRTPGVFLSGNGPLVKIVRAAIERDFKRRSKQGGEDRTSGTFIQNVHEFVRDGLAKPGEPPAENMVVFDEAQRAWNAKQNEKNTGRSESEPATVLGIMDRHEDWAAVVALVGGGQEINVGEAGLSEWGRTIRDHFPHWQVAVSPGALVGDASVAGHQLFADNQRGSVAVREEPSLHLDVNLRAFRVQKLTEWVNAVLAADTGRAKSLMGQLEDFPLTMTRELAVARNWLRERTRGLRRCGLVASSGAIRLRAHGLELSSGFRQGNRDLYVHWFLNHPPDVRSSNQLEVAASEFECQGLELDWVGVCWGGDLSLDPAVSGWEFRHFAGSKWQDVVSPVDRAYLLNTYRVLLTRAREGSIVWIPHGDADDRTRDAPRFDRIADHLRTCGLCEV